MKTLENIRSELMYKATSNVDARGTDLDNDHKLLLDYMAHELYGLYKELDGSRVYIENQVKNHLNAKPGNRPRPVHMLAQAIPDAKKVVLKPGEHNFQINRSSNKAPFEINFSPIQNTQLLPAEVRWFCSGNTLRQKQEDGIYIERAKCRTDGKFHPGIAWIGVEYQKNMEPVEALTFHIDWGREITTEELISLLPLVRWDINGTLMHSIPEAAHLSDRRTANAGVYPDAEFLHLYALEKEALRHYERQFITVRSKDGIAPMGLPEEIKTSVDQTVLSENDKENLVWIKLIFPAGFTPLVIADTRVKLNCFPILNWKLDKSQDFVAPDNQAVFVKALSNSSSHRNALSDLGEYFLGMESVDSALNKEQSSSNTMTNYLAAAFRNFKDVSPGHYAVQQGRVEASDFRDTLFRTGELIELLGTHGERIGRISNHSVDNAITELKKGYELMQHAFSQIPAHSMDPGIYLHVKVLNPAEMIYVQFWVTQGEAAKGVVRSNNLFLADIKLQLLV